MEKLFEESDVISILTVTCSQVKFDYFTALTNHLQNGGKLRILTVAREKYIFNNVMYFGEDGNKVDSMMVNHFNILESLMRRWNSYIKDGHCQIGLISEAPPYRLILTKSKECERTAILLPRPLSVTGTKFLACRLDGTNHKSRITYLENQYETLWNKATFPASSTAIGEICQ